MSTMMPVAVLGQTLASAVAGTRPGWARIARRLVICAVGTTALTTTTTARGGPRQDTAAAGTRPT